MKAEHSQLLYDMNNRNDVPGYGYQLKRCHGFDRIWPALERSLSTISCWVTWWNGFIAALVVLDKESNSIGLIILNTTQVVGNIISVNSSFQSPYGLIVSEWKKDGKKLSLKVTVPVNTDAVIYLPVTDTSFLKEAGTPIKNKRIYLMEWKNNIATFKVGSDQVIMVRSRII